MTKLIMHEIDGTDTIILARQADEYFTFLKEGVREKCLEKGIHLYKEEDGTAYLAGEDGVILAKGMSTIRTYVEYLL